ncbi:trichohyalin-like isoform X2 [Sparus aurata]|uniref:trichohyalin-like isoform X2 n=1 Tax=Sparus aurata TaxID=8175 RepID=UPI0011C14073|nr:trichohyalin-like isoform X2 [Sparus aurata]
MFKNTSPGRGHSALSAESRRLSMSETDGGPESLESRRLHAPEIPTRSLGGRREVRENVRELFRSKVKMFESAGNAKLKPDDSVHQLELQDVKNDEQILRRRVEILTAEGVQLKGLHETNQAEIKQLKATVRALKESEDSLKQQHVSIANELSQHESLTERQNQQNRNLKAAVQDLQCRLNAAEQEISDKVGCRTRQEDEVSAGVENFSQQCSFLVEKCDDLTAERDQLKSLGEEHHTEAEQLKATVRALKESEDSLQQQHVSIANELSQYESLTERQNQQNKSLKTAVQDLQCRLKEAEQEISDKDGCRTRQEEEFLAGVEDFSQQCSVWAEKCDNLTAERGQLLSLREEHHTEAGQLREALQSLQTKERFLNEDVHNLTAEGVRYESLIQKNQAEIKQLKKTAQTETQNHLAAVQQLESLMDEKQREIEKLRVELRSLQDGEQILNEQVENLTAEEVRYESLIQKHQAQIQQLKRTAQTETENHLAAVEQLESLIDEKQQENERLRAALQSLQTRERFLNEDVDSLTAEGVQLKQLNETNQAEIKQLKATVRALKESEDSLKQQHVSIANKLSQHESLTERQNQQNRNLKAAVQDLQSLLDEAEQQIFDKDELIKKRDREIEFNQQLVEELNTKRLDLNQSICDLKDQLEARQEEEILAGVENFSQHSSLWAGKCDNLSAERDQLNVISLSEEHHTEADQMRVLIETRYHEIENNQQLVEELNTERSETNKSICDHKYQLETRQEEEEEEVLADSPEPDSPEKLRDDGLLESPLAEPRAAKVQIGSFWRRCARRLLVLSVAVGLISTGALVSGSFMAYNISMNGQNTYCHLEPGVPCPI